MIGTGFAASAIAVGMLFSAVAHAQTVSKDEYAMGGKRITAEHKSAKDACKSLAGNARDICVKEADAKATVARGDLKLAYQPGAKNRYDASVKAAKAEYAVAKERCDDKAGNDKHVCLKEAKAVEVAAQADAKAKMKISDANGVAVKKTATARTNAASDKRDADYAVAKEKCDVFAADAKARCMDDAKATFGKP
jgi:hypothetical protein